MTMRRAAYIYGIVGDTQLPPRDVKPVGAERTDKALVPLELADCSGLGVLWTPAPSAEIQRTRRNLLAHTRVLEDVMAETTVLPMRFGVVADDPELLSAAVVRRREELESMLRRFDGLSETGVRITWPRDAMMQSLRMQYPALEGLSRKLAAKGGGSYQDRINLGREVASRIEEWRKLQENDLLQRLRGLARDVAVRAPESDVQVLRADFLVDVADETRLMAALAEVGAEAPGPPEIRCVGPAPLYNFVSLQLELPDAAADAGRSQG